MGYRLTKLRKKQMNIKTKRNCKNCNKTFLINNGGNLYCSTKCKNVKGSTTAKYKTISARERCERRKLRFFNLYTKHKGCVDCKTKFDTPLVYEFDHTDGTTTVSREIGSIHYAYKRSLKVLFKEIRKGQYICSNCHKLRTHKRKQFSIRKYK